MARTTPAWAFTALALFWLAGNAVWAQTPIGTTGEAIPIEAHVEAVVKAITLYLARFVEFAAALVIGIASVRGIWAYFVSLADGQAGAPQPKEEIRLSLGRSLALALEFELGADILSTAVAPSWDEIGKLAAIAVIRTALNFFLEKELRNAEARDPNAARRTMTDAAKT